MVFSRNMMWQCATRICGCPTAAVRKQAQMIVNTEYNPALVVLSVLIAILAPYTALDLGARVRVTTGRASKAWIAAASVAMGGGIWSMHFVAMLAFQMPMPVAYDASLTLLSLLLAVAVTAIGFGIVRRKAARLGDTVLSGVVMGIGIAGMHYTGMAAMRMDGEVHYYAPLVALSVMIAIAAATMALWLALRQQSLWQKLAAAIAMGAAIAGMHYTGMTAATFTVLVGMDHRHAKAVFRSVNLALGIGGASVLILCLALLAAFVDRRFRQHAEREAFARCQAERRFRLLVQGVTDYAIYMLDTQGNVANWNSGAQRSKGYTADEIVGQHFSRFFPSESIEARKPEAALETALREGRYENEGWRVRKDGSRFWGNVVVDPIREDDGALIGFGVVTRDMTERHETRRALDQAKEQLFQAQKMEAVGQLTGGIAHGFNNLLTVVTGSLELAQSALKSGTPHTALANIDRALRGGSRAATLTRLLSFARRQALLPRTVDLNVLVAGMSDMLEGAIGEGITVRPMPGDGLWPVYVDPHQLESCLLNLVINARDAMPHGGSVIIETINSPLDAAYAARHDGVVPGEYVLIAVTDTGFGMAPQVLEHAFEPFFTTKDIGAGSGLGLSQVFGFVKQSGGHLEICSEPGAGTTVRLYLPRHSGLDSPTAAHNKTPEPVPEQGRETVLIVEDEADVRAYASCSAEGRQVMQGTGTDIAPERP
jgi:PAS domain S-box-containing protein